MDTFLEALEIAATCIRAGDREKAAKLLERTAAVLREAPGETRVTAGRPPDPVVHAVASVTALRPPDPWIQVDKADAWVEVDGADVVSPYWRLRAADPGQAKRIAEVIGGAFDAGWQARTRNVLEALR